MPFSAGSDGRETCSVGGVKAATTCQRWFAQLSWLYMHVEGSYASRPGVRGPRLPSITLGGKHDAL